MNVLSVIQARHFSLIQRGSAVTRFTTHDDWFSTMAQRVSLRLLIVGPRKTSTNYLRQTYGERFLEFYEQSKFLNKIECLSPYFATVQTQTRTSSCLWCDPVSSRNWIVCTYKRPVEVTIDRQNFEINFSLKQIRKRSCKNNVDHYNAIPSLTSIANLRFWSAACIDRLKVY